MRSLVQIFLLSLLKKERFIHKTKTIILELSPCSPLSTFAPQVAESLTLGVSVCLLLQDLLQSCARVRRRIVEDMCSEIVDTTSRGLCGLG